MMYPYITLSDETLVTHSQILDKDGTKTVEVHFERPINGGFDSARCNLLTYEWILRDGYTDDEIVGFEQFLKSNAHLFYRYAENGGI